MKDTIRKAIEPANGWLKSVDQLSLINRLSHEDLTSEETETLIRDRVSAEGLSGRDYENRVRELTRSGIVVTETELRRIERDRLRRDGYNDQEIEEVLKDKDAVRAEFQKMYDELKGLIWKTLKKAYDKAHECCMKEAKDFYLGMMDGLGRQLTIGGQGKRSRWRNVTSACARLKAFRQDKAARGPDRSHIQRVLWMNGTSPTVPAEYPSQRVL